MQEAKRIVKAMTRLDGKAEKMNKNRTIRIKRMIKTYSSLLDKLERALRRLMPVSSSDADVNKMQSDMIKWAESNRLNKQGRQIQRAFPKRHGLNVRST